MTFKPHRLPGDPARVIKDWLADVATGAYPGSGEYPPMFPGAALATFAMNLPSAWNRHSGTHVGVFDDGGPVNWPVSTEPRVRITVWANGRDAAREAARTIMGWLMAYRIEGVATITNPTALLDAIDKHNGAHLCSFTVAAQARTSRAN